MIYKRNFVKNLIYAAFSLILLTVVYTASADVIGQGSYPGPNDPDPLRDIPTILEGKSLDGYSRDMGDMQLDYIRHIADQLGITTSAYFHPHQQLPSLLWISSANETDIGQFISLPLNSTAQEFLMPGTSGYLVLNEEYPDGHVRNYNLGYVNEGHKYGGLFIADTLGMHIEKFDISIGNLSSEYSNKVEFNVVASNI